MIFCARIDIATAALDGAKIDQITGLKGKLNEKENVYKVTWLGSDVKVAVDGWAMPPFMGLGTWAAFTQGSNTEAVMMGDTVLFEDEVNPAMSIALENGLSVTALHNHFLFDHPKVYFMHIEGQGTTEELANAVRKVYDKVKAVRAASQQPKDSFGAKSLPEKNSITPVGIIKNISDSVLLDIVQRQTFRYFWNFGHPRSGLARERDNTVRAEYYWDYINEAYDEPNLSKNTFGPEACAIGGTGMGILATVVAVNRG